MGLADFLQWNISVFILIFSRWAGMVMLAPVFGAQGVPALVRLGLAGGMSIVVFPLVQAQAPTVPGELLPYAGLIIKEILVGLTIGFIMSLITSIMLGAGQLMDFQLGFIMGNTVDPINGLQSPLTGRFLMVLATLLLLATDSHHYMVAALLKSYDYIPISTAAIANGTAFFIDITSKVIAISLQIALPVYGALVLADIGIGLLTKTVPQLNIFAVIFAVKIIFGIILLYLMLTLFGDSVSWIFDLTMEWTFELLRGWRQ